MKMIEGDDDDVEPSGDVIDDDHIPALYWRGGWRYREAGDTIDVTAGIARLLAIPLPVKFDPHTMMSMQCVDDGVR